MAKKKKRKVKKKRVALLIILLFTAALLAVAMTAPFFNINKITITGCEHITEEEVLLAASIPKGENIWRTNLGRAEKMIKKIPYVDEAEVLRKFPDKVVIKIIESEIAAYIQNGDRYIGIDKKGKVIEITDVPPDKINILGFEAAEFVPGEIIKFQDSQNDEVLYKCLDEFEKRNLSPVIESVLILSRIEISFTTKEGLKVVLGSTDELDYKLKLFSSIIEKGYTKGVFDVSNTSMPTYRSVE